MLRLLLVLAVLSVAFGFRLHLNNAPSMQTRTLALHMNSHVQRNPNFGKLQSSYVFSEIARRRKVFLENNPEAKLVSLGIGDTTLPIPPYIMHGLVTGAAKLGNKQGYTGYGAEQGMKELREKIAYKLYDGKIEPEEVFVSDGAKCDIARLQMMFGSKVISAVQDPSYPVYVETAVMIGQTGVIDEQTKQFQNILYMPCNPDNNFFPDVEKLPRADVYYICSPNNPTGAVASRENLESLVRHAKKVGSIIVFDAAYAPFIRTPGMSVAIITHHLITFLCYRSAKVNLRNRGSEGSSDRSQFLLQVCRFHRCTFRMDGGSFTIKVF